MLLQIQGCAFYCLGCFVEHTSLLSPPIGRQGCVLKFELCEKGVWFSLCSMLLFGNMGVLIRQNSTLQGPLFLNDNSITGSMHIHVYYKCTVRKYSVFLQCLFAVFVWVSFALMRCSKNYQNDEWTQSRLANKKTTKTPRKIQWKRHRVTDFPRRPLVTSCTLPLWPCCSALLHDRKLHLGIS